MKKRIRLRNSEEDHKEKGGVARLAEPLLLASWLQVVGTKVEEMLLLVLLGSGFFCCYG